MAQRVGRGIALLFHDRGTRRGWVVSSTPRPHFTSGIDPVPIVQEDGWDPGPAWNGGKCRPHRDSIPDRPVRSQSVYRLSFTAQLWGELGRKLHNDELRHLSSDTFLIPTKCTTYTYYIHMFDVYLLHVLVPVHHHQGEATVPVTWKPNYSDDILIYGFSFEACISSLSSSSYIFHGVGPLVDPFRSHVSSSLFKGLPWFLLPVGV